MNSITLNSWSEVTDYVEQGFLQVPNWMFEHVVQHNSYYPAHAFSKGQLASKSWLLQQLWHAVDETMYPNEVAILGAWIGSLNPFLQKSFNPNRVYGIDCDAEAVEKSERLNQRWVQDSWKYKGVVADVDQLDCADMQFETGGELINCKPNWIINTSSEHMNTDWFHTVANDQLIIMQTNNSADFEGHINPMHSIEHMQMIYPLEHTLFVGELKTPAYTRYMQIGYKL